MNQYNEMASKFLVTVVPEFRKDAMLHLLYRFSKGETFVLTRLLRNKGSASPSYLKEELGSSTARIAMLLKTLEEKEMITRTADEADKRKVIVRITPKGEKHAIESHERVNQKTADVFEEMGADEAEKFIELFQKYIEISTRNNEEKND
ncbi:MAG: transcriptional regulator [Lactobacillales bacterium]|jgi:DNA-binding MarR family transcriptional regulator|nr:transcriptional regulator [Lactobacillales bacterium]